MTSPSNNETGSTSSEGASVFVAGDCWLKRGSEPFELSSLWQGAPPELFVVNLECAVPSGPVRPKRRALLPMDPDRLPELAVARQNVCIVANNHVTDYGQEGLISTIEGARAAGLLTIGAGETLAQAREPVIVEAGGRTIGMLAYAGTEEYVGSVAATDNTPGVAPLDLDLVTEDLEKLALKVDDLWLFVHWGREYVRYPEPQQRELAKSFVEAGATAVIGAHPHVVLGWEHVENVPVYYSLGNFVFPSIDLTDGPVYRWDARNCEGLALKGELRNNAWQWAHMPYVVSADGSPRALNTRMESALLKRFDVLCSGFTPQYASDYPQRLRQEKLLHAMRRIRMMSWQERWQRFHKLLPSLAGTSKQ